MQEIRKVLYTVFFIKLEKTHFGSNLGRFWPKNLKQQFENFKKFENHFFIRSVKFNFKSFKLLDFHA